MPTRRQFIDMASQNNTKASVGIIIELKKKECFLLGVSSEFPLSLSLSPVPLAAILLTSERLWKETERRGKRQTDRRGGEKRWGKHQYWGHERTSQKEMLENRDNDLLGMHNQMNESNYAYIYISLSFLRTTGCIRETLKCIRIMLALVLSIEQPFVLSRSRLSQSRFLLVCVQLIGWRWKRHTERCIKCVSIENARPTQPSAW